MKFILSVLLVLMSNSAYSQSLKEIYDQSMEAYKTRDYASYHEFCLKALEIHPSQPTILYNLASSLSLLGENDEAHDVLLKLLTWNADLEYEEDWDFRSMLEKEDLKTALESRKKEMQSKVVLSSEWAVIPGQHHIEDLDIEGDVLYLTDIHQGLIFKYSIKSKQLQVVEKLKGAAFAIAVNNHELWSSSSIFPNHHRFDERKENEASLYRLDLAIGTQVDSIPLKTKAVIGSLLIQDGFVYGTNSLATEIVKVNRKDYSYQILHIEGAHNLQGITSSSEQEYAYVADYIKGIGKVSLKTSEVEHWLNSPSYLLKGIDGLNFINDSTLIAIQNNSIPKKVIKIKHDGANVESVDLLDNDLMTNGEPTNGKYLEGLGFLYISNSPWPLYNRDGSPKQEEWEEQKIRLIPEQHLH